MFQIRGDGLITFRAKWQAVATQFRLMLPGEVRDAGSQAVDLLRNAAPRGANPGPPPGDDAEGSLVESFDMKVEEETNALYRLEIVTSQPTKTRYVRFGTGLFGPVGQRIRSPNHKPLFWPGAPEGHPWWSVAGMKPNDFVTPVLDALTTELPQRFTALTSSIFDLF